MRYLPLTKKFQSITDKSAPVLAILFVIVLWYFCNNREIIPAYMLPSPYKVAKAFADNFSIMMKQASVTLQEACYGLLAGIAIAFVTAALMDRFGFLYKAVYPLLVVSQTIPTIAIAPLLVLWMGFGMAPKITLVVVTTFFPISIGLLGGYRGVDPDAVNLMRAMGANRVKIFRYVKIPNALPGFFSGLKISASYAVVGAVISEWLGGFEGLGVYMTRVKKAYAFDKMFAVIVFISVISLLLMLIITLLEKACTPWNRQEEKKLHRRGNVK